MDSNSKTECCNAKIEGVMEYAREEPWGAVGGHYECGKCRKEVTGNGESIERLNREYEKS